MKPKPTLGKDYFQREQAGREARRASMSEIMDMADEAYSAAMRKCDDVERKLSYPKLKKAAEAGNRIEPKGAKRG